jgi:putative ABC transport system permease protein
MFKLALRNVFRHKGRTALTLAAICFGVIGLMLSGGFVEDIFIQLGETSIHSQTGHLQLAKAGFFTHGSRSPEKYAVPNYRDVAASVSAMAEVDQVMARVDFSGLLNNGRSDLAIIGEGLEPEKEARLGTHLRMVEGRQLSKADNYGIVVGEGVAKAMKLKPGDSVTLLTNTAEGAMNSVDYEVMGVFQTFSKDFDARAVRVALTAAQELVSSTRVNKIVVSLKRTEDTEPVAAVLQQRLQNAGLEVQTWRELNDFYSKTVDLYKRQFGVLRLIILMMVLLSVANSVNMSVNERLGEFGTLQATGSHRSHVFGLVVTETVLLGFIGGIAGAVLGVLLASAISATGIPMPPPPNANVGYTARIHITPSLIVVGFAIGFISAILAGLWPAARVSRTPVVEALRANI